MMNFSGSAEGGSDVCGSEVHRAEERTLFRAPRQLSESMSVDICVRTDVHVHAHARVDVHLHVHVHQREFNAESMR